MSTAATLAMPLRYRSAARSHAGCRRPSNQDRVLDRADAGLWAVADGVGGHQDGARAAALLVDALEAVAHGSSGYRFLAEIEAQVQAVNGLLAAEAGDRGRAMCGSTLVALIAHDDHFACLWAGDSRAYRLRGPELTRISHDHSVVQALVDAGELSEGARRGHARGNVITRAIGAGPTLELDRRFAAIQPGDCFLLCSDGLTACLDDAELADELARDDPEAIADALLAGALARDAADNVSIVVIRADGVL